MSWLLEGVGFVNCLVPTESSEYTRSSSGGPILTGRSTNLAQLARHNPSSQVITYLTAVNRRYKHARVLSVAKAVITCFTYAITEQSKCGF